MKNSAYVVERHQHHHQAAHEVHRDDVGEGAEVYGEFLVNMRPSLIQSVLLSDFLPGLIIVAWQQLERRLGRKMSSPRVLYDAAPTSAKQNEKICEIIPRAMPKPAEWAYYRKWRSNIPPRVYLQEGARPGGSDPAAGLFEAQFLLTSRIGPDLDARLDVEAVVSPVAWPLFPHCFPVAQ